MPSDGDFEEGRPLTSGMRRRLPHALCVASLLALAAACDFSGARDAAPPGAATAVSVAPIIGGVLATDYPESAILDMDKGASGSYYACSGTLVAPRVVLTAGHCVDGHKTWDVYVHGEYRSSTTAVTYDWAEGGAANVNPNHHDLGLVFLGQPITLAAYPTLATTMSPDGTKVSNIGRIRDGVFTSTSYRASTTVSGAAPWGYPFDYISPDIIQPGDSGGAVVLFETHTLVAVNSGAGAGFQVLARVDVLSGWLQGQLAAYAVAPPDAGAPPPPPEDAGAPPPPPEDAGAPVTLTPEQEPNGDAATASPFTDGVSGNLAGVDVDWVSFGAPSGTTRLQLSSDGDAVFAVGNYVDKRCVLMATGRTSALITVVGGTASLCAQIRSPGQASQTYAFTRR
jgi:hypothetical protein